MLWPKKFGAMCLAIGLIFWGLRVLVPAVNFSGSENVLAVLAIVAGILIWLDR
jgi:hypothetical protein